MATITNLDPDFLMNTYEHIGSFMYPSLIKYLLKRLYHILLDYFNPYNDLCNFTEYNPRDLFILGFLNPLVIFI